MYDVIGDIHGHYAELHALLGKLGYTYSEDAHIFMPPQGRKAIFMGDYIDRGPDSLKTIALVQNMLATGLAYALLGNHEFNAVMWATPHPRNEGTFLRSHSEANLKQHKKFLQEIGENSAAHHSAIEWFKSLPVYLELCGNCFIHACWDVQAILDLQKAGLMTPDGRFTETGWLEVGDRESPYYAHAEILLKGPEENLPDGLSYPDAQGNIRRKGRVAWWNVHPKTLGEAFGSLPSKDLALRTQTYNPATSNEHIRGLRAQIAAMPDKKRICVGHYWEKGNPEPLSENVCCVDYSVAKGGKLVAYRMQPSECGFVQSNFVSVEATTPHITQDRDLHEEIIQLMLSAGHEAVRMREAGSLNPRKKTEVSYSTITDADLALHKILTAGMKERFPGSLIISEEDSDFPSDSSYKDAWLIDPIDATTGFSRGNPRFSVLLARIENGVPVEGFIYFPDPRYGIIYYTDAKAQKALKQHVALYHGHAELKGAATEIVASPAQSPLRLIQKHIDATPYISGDLVLTPKYPDPFYTIAVLQGSADIGIGPGSMCDWDLAPADALIRKVGGCFVNISDGSPLVYGQARPPERAFLLPSYAFGHLDALKHLTCGN